VAERTRRKKQSGNKRLFGRHSSPALEKCDSQVLVAQPLLAVRVLRSSIVYEFVEIEKTTQPRVAVLIGLSGSFVGRGFSRDIQKATLGAFRP
jgi:hypothetical protein